MSRPGGERGAFPHHAGRRTSELWDTYESLAGDYEQLAMRRLNDGAAVWGVLADLFAKSSGRVPA